MWLFPASCFSPMNVSACHVLSSASLSMPGLGLGEDIVTLAVLPLPTRTQAAVVIVAAAAIQTAMTGEEVENTSTRNTSTEMTSTRVKKRSRSHKRPVSAEGLCFQRPESGFLLDVRVSVFQP